MSTDRAKKKRGVPRVDRVKMIEYVCIGLVILLFLGLALYYGGDKGKADPVEAEVTLSPVPTADPSIRGKNILDAIEGSAFTLTYRRDHYDIASEDGIVIEMCMQSDDSGIRRLFLETELFSDPEEENEISEFIKEKNKQSTKALQDLLDLIMPVLRRTVSDSDVIVSQCKKVVESGEPYSKHIGKFTVRIQSEPEAIPQTVMIEFIRDP